MRIFPPPKPPHGTLCIPPQLHRHRAPPLAAGGMLIAALRVVQPRLTCARSQLTLMGKKSFYAVAVGRRPGVYRSWEDCAAQVLRHAGSVYKGFATEAEALGFLATRGTVVGQQQHQNQQHVWVLQRQEEEEEALPPRPSTDAPADDVGPPASSSGKRKRVQQQEEQEQQPEADADKGPGGLPCMGRTLRMVRRALHQRWGARGVAAAGARRPRHTRTQTRACRSLMEPQSPTPGRRGLGQYSTTTPLGRRCAVCVCLLRPVARTTPAHARAVAHPPCTPPPQVLRLCRYMGDRHTNNQAEYGGLIAGLQVGGWVGGMTRDVPRALPPLNSTRHTCTPPPPTTTLSQAALDLGCRDIKVQGDSKLVVEQASVCVGGRGGIVQGTRLRPR